MTRRDWWLGVALLVAAILAHAAFPRYEWRGAFGVPTMRIDRWTGGWEVGHNVDGRWVEDGARAPARH